MGDVLKHLKELRKYQPKEGGEKRKKQNNNNIQIWKISAQRGRQKKFKQKNVRPTDPCFGTQRAIQRKFYFRPYNGFLYHVIWHWVNFRRAQHTKNTKSHRDLRSNEQRVRVVGSSNHQSMQIITTNQLMNRVKMIYSLSVPIGAWVSTIWGVRCHRIN